MTPKSGQGDVMNLVPILIRFRPFDGKSHKFFRNFYIRQCKISTWIESSYGMRGNIGNSQNPNKAIKNSDLKTGPQLIWSHKWAMTTKF